MPSIKGVDDLVLTRHRNVIVSDDRALRRAAARGDMTRLRIGAYVPTTVWASLSRDERHRLAAAAAASMSSSFVATHRTAAAVWGVPLIGRGDGLVHTRVTTAAGTRTEHGYRKHGVADTGLHCTTVEGVPVTTLDRTVIDLLMSESFESGVVATDWALSHGATPASLSTVLDELAPKQGRARATATIAFADGSSGSAGESYSRAQMERHGLLRPQLQARFDDRDGLIGFVDFFWPECGLIGEFDGLEKYTKREFAGERTPSQVVTDEKVREDRLRATEGRPAVSRWIWPTVLRSGALASQLRAAGVPLARRDPGAFG